MNFPFDKTPRFVPQGMIILDHWISYYSVKILSQLASVLKLLFSSVHVKNKKRPPKYILPTKNRTIAFSSKQKMWHYILSVKISITVYLYLFFHVSYTANMIVFSFVFSYFNEKLSIDLIYSPGFMMSFIGQGFTAKYKFCQKKIKLLQLQSLSRV